MPHSFLKFQNHCACCLRKSLNECKLKFLKFKQNLKLRFVIFQILNYLLKRSYKLVTAAITFLSKPNALEMRNKHWLIQTKHNNEATKCTEANQQGAVF